MLPDQIEYLLHDIEETIIEFALKRSPIWYPFRKEELIDFSNNLIKDKPLQEEKIAWQTLPNTKL